MRIIVKIIGILLLISSCTCFKIKNDVRRSWSSKFNQCRCQWYNFKEVRSEGKFIPCEDFFLPEIEKNIENCKDTEFSTNYPELCDQLPNKNYCDHLVGFSIQSWAGNITPHAKESKSCYEDECGK